MRRWVRPWISGATRQSRLRYLSTVTSGPTNVERVSVKCGLAGSISVDLHNIAKVSSLEPLLIYLPPYSANSTQSVSRIPAFCRGYPTAVIHYRWTGYDPFEDAEPPSNSNQNSEEAAPSSPHHRWPVPVHDTLQAYSWIVQNLTPPIHKRRDVYVYGSYLGATLATSLALTECFPHQRMAVRGVVAYNGIYNWTMFLPDHQINKKSGHRAANILEEILGQPTDPTFQDLQQHTSALFGDPANLFDPFASPCLFFQTPGLLVPQDFDSSSDPVISMLRSSGPTSDDAKEEAVESLVAMMVNKPPRRSPLAFPPRNSIFKLPETLLLHSPPPVPSVILQRRPQKRKKPVVSNHFGTQAEELAALMRRSLEKLEFKERAKWDDGFDEYQEIERRVQVRDVGMDEGLLELPGRGEALVHEWFKNHMSGRI